MMKLSELTAVANITYQGDDLEITNLSCHSGQIKHGGLFFAVRGGQKDGADFVPQAVQNGAVAIIAERPVQTTVPVIVVSDVGQTMVKMTERFYPSEALKKVAVTGTNGKTSTVYYVAQIMNALGVPAASMGTIGVNSPLLKKAGSMTTPDTCVMHENLNALQAAGVQAVAMEASSHGLDQGRLDGVMLMAGAFTNLTQDHLDYHKTMQAYLSAKIKLFDKITVGGYAVLNADIPEFNILKETALSKGLQVISYGKQGNELRILEQKPLAIGQRVSVYAFGKTYDMDLNIVGDFQLMNILCAIGLCVGLGANAEDIMQVVPLLKAPEGRLERVAILKNNASIYVDYAHTPDALERVLKTMRLHTQGRLVCVFGCGGNRDAGKRPLMGEIANRLADVVYITVLKIRPTFVRKLPRLVRKGLKSAIVIWPF